MSKIDLTGKVLIQFAVNMDIFEVKAQAETSADSLTVGNVRALYAGPWGIESGAKAYLNGMEVDEDTVVAEGQILEFRKTSGKKGTDSSDRRLGRTGFQEYIRLKNLCRDHGLHTGGKKDELHARLLKAGVNPDADDHSESAAPVATSSENRIAEIVQEAVESAMAGRYVIPPPGIVLPLDDSKAATLEIREQIYESHEERVEITRYSSGVSVTDLARSNPNAIIEVDAGTIVVVGTETVSEPGELVLRHHISDTDIVGMSIQEVVEKYDNLFGIGRLTFTINGEPWHGDDTPIQQGDTVKVTVDPEDCS
ncbi:MAG: SAP domain-containing protein [Deltaproteobacteria bacterium]|nr:SAP domain-containing protein [Deltaproteobacteria bacterium]